MFLDRLREVSERLEDVAPLGYAEGWVRYEIHLDREGQLLSPEPFDLADVKAKQGQRRQIPQVVRANAIRPLLLSDNAEYTLGLARQEGDADKQAKRDQRVATSHTAYLSLLEKCADVTQAPEIRAVQRFLNNEPLARLRLPDQFDTGRVIAFRVEGQLVTDLPAVKQFWRAHALGDEAEGDADNAMQCLICGNIRPALISLPGNIRGLPGGQAAGMALISANEKAFESYGLERSQTSPVCLECADAFTKALNSLIRDERSAYRLGDLTFVYWTRESVGFSLSGFLREPDAAEVGDLIKTYRTGGPLLDTDETSFYAVALSANAARVVVRDWLDTTVGHVKQGLAGWFARQRIVDAYGEASKPLGLYALAAATVRDPTKDLPVTIPRALLRSALTGSPLPIHLLYALIRRNVAERDVTRPRAALIKIALVNQTDSAEEEAMVQLQPDHPKPGYHCGRLLAVLEQIQRAALGNINATIVDRFYGTASTAPASVFGRLVRGAQPHLSKLLRDAPGTGYALQRDLEEVLSSLTAFPRTLTLTEQGYFALGYYHQRAHNRAQARAAAERRRAAKAVDTAEANT